MIPADHTGIVRGNRVPTRPCLRPLARRRAVQATAGALISAGVMASGCSRAAATLTKSAAKRIVVTVELSWAGNKQIHPLLAQAFGAFTHQHPDITVHIVPQPATSSVASILAGAPSDIISDWYLPFYSAGSNGNLLTDLSPFMKTDNVSPSLWPTRLIDQFRTGNGLVALPSSNSALMYVVRLDEFDVAGLPYPDVAWDYREFARICGQLTKKTPHGTRPGANYPWWTNGIREATFTLNGFGTSLTGSNGMTSNLGTKHAMAAGNWVYEQLFWPGVCYAWDQSWPLSLAPGIAKGLSAMQFSWGAGAKVQSVFGYALLLRGTKWRFYPFPRFPAGPATLGSNSFWAIPRNAPHPHAAWRVLKFMATDKTFNRTIMKTTASFPALKSLAPEWTTFVESVAPPLRGKNVHWQADAILKDYAYPMQFYRYSDASVRHAIAPQFTSLFQHKKTVPLAFQQAAKTADAIEAAAVTTSHTLATLEHVKVSSTSRYSAPATVIRGAGAAPVASHYGLYNPVAKTWTLLGDGAVHATSDTAVFACVPATKTEESWVARIRMISNLSCPHLSQWSVVGLMMREALSPEAPMITCGVMGPWNMQWQYRAQPNTAPASSMQIKPPGVTHLLKTNTKHHANYVTRPIWVKLSRIGLKWIGHVSLDGSSWTIVGAQTAPIAGAWVGIFASANNSSFGNKGYTRAVFDRVSFHPNRVVQIGKTGAPPGAGAVLKHWMA